MARTRKNGIDMTTGALLPKILLFALPLTATGLLQMLFNAADSAVVGKFAGNDCLAAVGATSQFAGLLVSLFNGIGTGVNIVVAQYLGAKNEEKVHKSVHCALVLAAVLGLIVSIVGWSITEPVLRAMETPDDIIDMSILYLRIYFLGSPASMMYNFGSAILRANGDTKKPMYFLMISGAVNVVLNVISVVVFHLDVAGVAIATVVSLYVSVFLVFRCLMKYDNCCKLELKELNLSPKYAFELIRVGIPTGIQLSLINISNVLTQSAMNTFGSVVLAGNAAATSLDGFVCVGVTSGMQAAVSFASQNYGAKKYKRIGKVLLNSILCVMIIGFPLCMIAYFGAPKLLCIYLDMEDPNLQAMIAAGITRLSCTGALYFLYGIMDCFVGTVRGMGHQVMPMIVSLVGLCGIRILWLQLFFRPGDLLSLYRLYPVSWIFTLVVQAIGFFVVYRKLLREKANCPEVVE